MRKFLIPIAVAGASAFAFSAPVSAQPHPYAHPNAGYAAPHNYGAIGAHNVHARVQGLRHQIRELHQRRLIDPRQAQSLDRQALAIERQMMSSSRFGVNPRRYQMLERRVARLEQRLQRQVARNSYGYRNAYGRRW